MICLHTLNMHYRFTSARIDIRLLFNLDSETYSYFWQIHKANKPTKQSKMRSKDRHSTSALTLKWRARRNIWFISWILCISGQRHTLGQVWRLTLTATVNFQHNQFMWSSIITICVLQRRLNFRGMTRFFSNVLARRKTSPALPYGTIRFLCGLFYMQNYPLTSRVNGLCFHTTN